MLEVRNVGLIITSFFAKAVTIDWSSFSKLTGLTQYRYISAVFFKILPLRLVRLCKSWLILIFFSCLFHLGTYLRLSSFKTLSFLRHFDFLKKITFISINLIISLNTREYTRKLYSFLTNFENYESIAMTDKS